MHWQPHATIDTLRMRADIMARIRDFFKKRDVLEVETPLIASTTVTDPHIASIPVLHSKDKIFYLQTSPEYAMKRLLAAGSGSIFQLCKAFRQDEKGRLHNPEFTMLEWYRIGFDHHALMDEMRDFFKEVFAISKTDRLTVANVFETYVGINPHLAHVSELKNAAKKHGIEVDVPDEKNVYLDILFTHIIEPKLGNEYPVFIYDYPASQAALAKIRDENVPVASRFEVYFKGVELGNGFHELQNAEEQRVRFEKDLQYRFLHQMDAVPVDELLLSALQNGLPDCAGVAMGVDRLIMLMLGYEKIANVISFNGE
jgi:lysyl-tRNA synthetase class 2